MNNAKTPSRSSWIVNFTQSFTAEYAESAEQKGAECSELVVRLNRIIFESTQALAIWYLCVLRVLCGVNMPMKYGWPWLLVKAIVKNSK